MKRLAWVAFLPIGIIMLKWQDFLCWFGNELQDWLRQ